MDFLKNLGIDLNETSNTEIIKTVNEARPALVDEKEAAVIFEVLEATGLNWNVKQSPAKFDAGEFGVKESESKVINWRSDNGAELATVGKDSYNILQNADAVKTVYEAGQGLFDQGHAFKHPWDNTGSRSGTGSAGSYGNFGGGSLDSGRKVFVQLHLPDAYIGKSDIKRYLTLTNTHDGSKSVGYGNGNQVVCCANTFAVAFREISKIRHTASMQERISEATSILQRMFEVEERQMEVFNNAANISLEEPMIKAMINGIFDDFLNKKPADVSTRATNQVKHFAADLETSVKEQGSTLWALFNGVTRYTNHSRTSKDKDTSLMFGKDASINQKAYNLMASLV